MTSMAKLGIIISVAVLLVLGVVPAIMRGAFGDVTALVIIAIGLFCVVKFISNSR